MVIDNDSDSNTNVLHVANLLYERALASTRHIEWREVIEARHSAVKRRLVQLVADEFVSRVVMQLAHDGLAVWNVTKVCVVSMNGAV